MASTETIRFEIDRSFAVPETVAVIERMMPKPFVDDDQIRAVLMDRPAIPYSPSLITAAAERLDPIAGAGALRESPPLFPRL